MHRRKELLEKAFGSSIASFKMLNKNECKNILQ